MFEYGTEAFTKVIGQQAAIGPAPMSAKLNVVAGRIGLALPRPTTCRATQPMMHQRVRSILYNYYEMARNDAKVVNYFVNGVLGDKVKK